MLFRSEYLVDSDWYKGRILTKQQSDIALCAGHIRYVEKIIRDDQNLTPEMYENLISSLNTLKGNYEYICSYDYVKYLNGTIGKDHIKSRC